MDEPDGEKAGSRMSGVAEGERKSSVTRVNNIRACSCARMCVRTCMRAYVVDTYMRVGTRVHMCVTLCVTFTAFFSLSLDLAFLSFYLHVLYVCATEISMIFQLLLVTR